MTNQISTDFPKALVAFLSDYLPAQRGFSGNTVLSYRDTFKLLLRFLVQVRNADLKKFQLNDLNRQVILDFLADYRSNGASLRAANQRLGAIKSFCQYAGTEHPDCLDSMLDIQSIKSHKSPGRTIQFLSVDHTAELVNSPDSGSRTGLRHRAVLSLLYDSGCRVQELCDLTVGDVCLNNDPATVCLHGKGGKSRVVFVTSKTAELLRLFKRRFHSGSLDSEPFIKGRTGGKLKRQGITYIVQKYGAEVCRKDPTFPKNIHCHMLRHSKAMHMLQAGVNIVYIRDFLGHEEITTTMVYARADNRTKEEVIGRLAPKVVGECQPDDWVKDKDLMSFLENMK